MSPHTSPASHWADTAQALAGWQVVIFPSKTLELTFQRRPSYNKAWPPVLCDMFNTAVFTTKPLNQTATHKQTHVSVSSSDCSRAFEFANVSAPAMVDVAAHYNNTNVLTALSLSRTTRAIIFLRSSSKSCSPSRGSRSCRSPGSQNVCEPCRK